MECGISTFFPPEALFVRLHDPFVFLFTQLLFWLFGIYRLGMRLPLVTWTSMQPWQNVLSISAIMDLCVLAISAVLSVYLKSLMGCCLKGHTYGLIAQDNTEMNTTLFHKNQWTL